MDWSLFLNWGFFIAIITAGIRLATPVLLAVLGEIITEKSGVLNLGADGVMVIGGVFGFFASYFLQDGPLRELSPWIGLCAGTLAGAVMGAIFSGFMVTLKVDQVISGVSLVLFGHGVANFLYRQAFSALAAQTIGLEPISIPFLSELPVLGPILFSQDPTVYIAFFLVIAVWFMLHKTTLGLKIRSAGEHPGAVATAGVDVAKLRYIATILGAALIGLSGAVLTVVQLRIFREGITGGRGWIAIALVIFAQWKPARALLGTFLFGIADAIQYRIQALTQLERGAQTIPHEFLLMLPYVLTLLVLAFSAKRSHTPEVLGQPYIDH